MTTNSSSIPIESSKLVQQFSVQAFLLYCVFLILLLLSTQSLAKSSILAKKLVELAPQADKKMLTHAAQAIACAANQFNHQPKRLAVIDYSKPSTKTRLWVFDLINEQLIFSERVAHGQGSGNNHTQYFSNVPGSKQTSLGLFRTGETYVGRNGYSLRLDGLEPGVNDRARERAIVMHGAPYVSDSAISQLGRLGRSWGCPAVRDAVARKLIDDIKHGQYLFAYYPDQHWIKQSPWISCADKALTVRAASLAP